MSYFIHFAQVLNGWLFFAWLIIMMCGAMFGIYTLLFRLIYGRWPRRRRGVL